MVAYVGWRVRLRLLFLFAMTRMPSLYIGRPLCWVPTTCEQSVEGINPSNLRAKIPSEITGGGLHPSWGGVRRGRATKRVAGREVTGLQHVLLRLAQASKMEIHRAMGQVFDYPPIYWWGESPLPLPAARSPTLATLYRT